MPSIVGFNYLCPPAYIYFVISAVWLIIFVLFLNNGSIKLNEYCVDSDCTQPNVAFMILFKAMFIIFWTWVLNFICRTGRPGVAWFLFLFPFIIMIISFLIVYEIVKKETKK
jgi:hypothetical protein